MTKGNLNMGGARHIIGIKEDDITRMIMGDVPDIGKKDGGIVYTQTDLSDIAREPAHGESPKSVKVG
jgi:hypothetical protein